MAIERQERERKTKYTCFCCFAIVCVRISVFREVRRIWVGLGEKKIKNENYEMSGCRTDFFFSSILN